MKTTGGDVTLELVRGDIAQQPDVDAVVNAANAELRTGGGVAGAIHRAAGPGLEEETREHAPIEPGQAVITGAHELPNENVIHCLGPVYGRDAPADELLAACYRNALAVAEAHGVRSIAFPAISTGAFGYPTRQAAEVMAETFLEILPERDLDLVRVVLWGEDAYTVHRAVLDDQLEGR